MVETDPGRLKDKRLPVEEEKRKSTERKVTQRDVWLGALLVVLVFGLVVEANWWRPGDSFGDRENVQITEAKAWWSGQLNLDCTERPWDTAVVNGKFYSHFPPMFTIIAAVAVPLFGQVPHWFVVLVIVLPVPLLSYVLFVRRTESALWGMVLAVGLLCGSSFLPVVDRTVRGASPYYINQVLGTLGILILLLDYTGRRRVWLAALGLMLAAWSRQLTIFYALPLLLLAFQDGERAGKWWRRAVACAACLAVVALPLSLNALKFGRPLDTGYLRIYEQRDDELARDAKTYGLFSPHFIPCNLYYANLGFPRVLPIVMAGEKQIHFRPNRYGTGIWWTTPLLIWLFVDGRRILGNPRSRMLLVAAAAVFAALMCFHGTGYDQRGFNRFSLDYLPVLLVLVAPYCCEGWRKWLSLAMVVWSVIYFRLLI